MTRDDRDEPNRLRVMIVGPLPPPIGGATLRVHDLVQTLRKRTDVDLEVADTCRRSGGWASAVWVACRALLMVALRGRSVDVITFHANENASKFLGPAIYVLARGLRKPLIVRAFGGNFDQQFASLGRTIQWVMRRTYLNVDPCLVQTRRMECYFEGYARRVAWFSTYT